MDGTKIVRFARTEKYACGDTLHVYREGETYRFIADFADRFLNMQAAFEVDGAIDGDLADLELTERPEPAPHAPTAHVRTQVVVPNRKAKPAPVKEPAKAEPPKTAPAAKADA